MEVRDTCVIYESRQDECWIAHSLRTDQIGTGGCVVEALEDLLRAIDQVMRLAAEDEDVQVFREAPARIRKMVRTAKPLPREIYEIAHKRVRGEWPKEFKPAFDVSSRRRWCVELHEAVAV